MPDRKMPDFRIRDFRMRDFRMRDFRMPGLLAGIFVFFVFVTAVQGQQALSSYLSKFEPVGSGRLTYLMWSVYDATLYAPNGKWRPNKPFALSTTYLRSVKGADIADRSAGEIEKLGLKDRARIERWRQRMRAIFPDMRSGTKITGLYRPGKPTLFYQGNRRIGSIRDPLFGKWFFDIWLSRKTSNPALRLKLLGRE